jgi:NhaP-type Na+/H+ or K+/H+ antiporter
MSEWALPTIALLLMGYGAISARLQATVVSQAMVFVALGLLVGNHFLNLVDVDAANQVVRHLAEATLTLVLFTDAVRVNLGRLRREALVPARLLGVGLPLTIVVGTLAAVALFSELNLWTAAALATILAPTDAALGLPVVTNRRLPSRIRQGLNVESGLNDGVCVPLLIIFLTVAEAEEGAGHIAPLRVVAEEIGFGVIGGVLAGALGALVLRSFAARGWMHGTWKQINAVATPLLAYSVAAALGGSGFIAAFVAGIAFGMVAGEHAEATTFLAEESGEVLNAVTFLLFGAVLLGPALGELDWRIALYAVLSLTVVRLLPVMLAMLGTGMRRVTVGFLGWFGPRGLASIVFVLLLVEQTDLPERPLLLAVVTWTVALSVYAHGLTAWPGANRYADWYAARAGDHAAMPRECPGDRAPRSRPCASPPADVHQPGTVMTMSPAKLIPNG